MEKIRKALLEETNYRCGSCMRNITPRVYYLDDSPDKNPIHDYVIYNYEKKAYYDTEEQKFYNISDRCHIIPNAEVKDEYNDFYNLIALCKICHHEVDKAKMLDITELKRLKLHWLIASGRFTKIEIDCLMGLYQTGIDKPDIHINHNPHKHHRWIGIRVLEKTPDYATLQAQFSIQNNMYFLFLRSIKEVLINEYIDPRINQSDFKRDLHFYLAKPKGTEFCKKFYDVYEQ